jgi:SAM-dependent methyltransferase
VLRGITFEPAVDELAPPSLGQPDPRLHFGNLQEHQEPGVRQVGAPDRTIAPPLSQSNEAPDPAYADVDRETSLVGLVEMGDLRRLTPFSRDFGFERGRPVDRYYIERFLAAHADDVSGRVLEIGDPDYTRRFGAERVTISDVLNVNDGVAGTTIVGDLASADHIPSDTFDCVILTQTLHLIYEVRAAIQTLFRILKPGGTLLATFPGISQRSCDEWAETWLWSFTTTSARRLFEEVFPASNVTVAVHGNVLAATAFLYGLAAEELRLEELDYRDPQYQLLITLRAVKPVYQIGDERFPV